MKLNDGPNPNKSTPTNQGENKMQRYQTENAKIDAEMPANTRNMTSMQIVEYMRKHFKVTGINDPANKSTTYLQAVSDAIFDPSDWKNPIYAIHPQCGKEWAGAAIIWYHGATPHQSMAGVYSQGYAC
jgi:hypothetical protein